MSANPQQGNPQAADPVEDPNRRYIAEIVARAPRMTKEQIARIRRIFQYGRPE